jgi:hypothetical protein
VVEVHGKKNYTTTAAIVPILLYRYLDAAAALKTIETWSFKVGRIRNFNDHFEWRAGLDPERNIELEE